MTLLYVGSALLFLAGVAAGGYTPTPPRRPQFDGPTEPDRADEAREDCLAELTDAGVRYQSLPRQEEGACVIAAPIRLEGVEASKSGLISFPSRPLIDCRLAERLADWLREAVFPLLRARVGASLRALDTGSGYECRTRNREPGARLSAHALGLALDISTFELSDRRKLKIGAMSSRDAEAAFDVVRRTACGWFTTVLGPGSSDKLHENHLHIDIQPHGSGEGYRICE